MAEPKQERARSRAKANEAETPEAEAPEPATEASEQQDAPEPPEPPSPEDFPTINAAGEDAGQDDRTFTKDRMIESSSALLGHPPHVLAGALADEEDDAELSVADASQRVKTFLGRELES